MGLAYVYKSDRTAVFVDVRPENLFAGEHLPGTVNIPHVGIVPGKKDVGEIRKAKNDGRLPYEDHNTRIVVYGQDWKNSSRVARAFVKEGFQNVTFFRGDIHDVATAIGKQLQSK